MQLPARWVLTWSTLHISRQMPEARTSYDTAFQRPAAPLRVIYAGSTRKSLQADFRSTTEVAR